MKATPLLLGIDIGTTSARVLLIDRNGRIRAEQEQGYPLLTPQPLWAEQQPEDWWQAVVKAIQAVLNRPQIRAGGIVAIGLTGQMHGLVLLGKENEVLRPAILWNDQRSAGQCRELTERIGADRIRQLTGNPLLAGFTAPKLAWVYRHEPEVWRRISRVLLPKDYVRFRLTGEFFSDVSDASGTALFDVGARRWSAAMLKAFRVKEDWLPTVTESPVASSHISTAAAQVTGLCPGTPVIAGAGDQAAGAIGAGAVREGIISVVIGTSGVVFAACRHYLPEPEGRLHAFCHAVPGMWHLMGVMLSAGGSLRWCRNTLFGADVHYEQLTQAAAKIPAGAEGLLFLPYLSGERTPYADADARGVFFGLSLVHTRHHLIRSVMEGVSFGLRDALELIIRRQLPVRELRLLGGGARSRLWRQILADVFDRPVYTVNHTQGAAFGAALLGGVGVGIFTSVADACIRTVKAKVAARPGPDSVIYSRYYPRYRALYRALREEFRELARVVSGSDNAESK